MAKKILIIDDDRGNVRIIQSALEKKGFATFPAFDGKEGLEMLPKVNPDLIILDVEMPVMNGYTFMTNKNKSPHYRPRGQDSSASKRASAAKERRPRAGAPESAVVAERDSPRHDRSQVETRSSDHRSAQMRRPTESPRLRRGGR